MCALLFTITCCFIKEYRVQAGCHGERVTDRSLWDWTCTKVATKTFSTWNNEHVQAHTRTHFFTYIHRQTRGMRMSVDILN